MQIKYNGCYVQTSCNTLFAFVEENDCSADVIIINGFSPDENVTLKENDDIILIKRGRVPKEETLDTLMRSRHTPQVHDKLKHAVVGIAGVGGLGSQVCIALARMGVGKFIVADYDVVEPSNLNRQAYFISHLGLKKVEALQRMLADVNPYTTIETHFKKVDKTNTASIFSPCHVIVEAFDNPKCKASLVQTVLSQLKVPIVTGSGMAGYGSSNDITTKRMMDRVYIVGDLKSEANFNKGLMATRVLVAAAHQANMVVRLLLDIKEP